MNKRQRKKQAKKRALAQRQREELALVSRAFAEQMSKFIFGHVSPLYMRLAGFRKEDAP